MPEVIVRSPLQTHRSLPAQDFRSLLLGLPAGLNSVSVAVSGFLKHLPMSIIAWQKRKPYSPAWTCYSFFPLSAFRFPLSAFRFPLGNSFFVIAQFLVVTCAARIVRIVR
ncbi:hypothetical protein [Pseudomonas sp. RT6P73]